MTEVFVTTVFFHSKLATQVTWIKLEVFVFKVALIGFLGGQYSNRQTNIKTLTVGIEKDHFFQIRFPTFICWQLKYTLYEVVNGFLTSRLARLGWHEFIARESHLVHIALYITPKKRQIKLEVRLAVLMQRPSTNNHLKVDWATLIAGSKFTIFALFSFVFESKFPSTRPRGAYIWRGDLRNRFLRYEFGGLLFGGAYFRSLWSYGEGSVQPTLRWAIFNLPREQGRWELGRIIIFYLTNVRTSRFKSAFINRCLFNSNYRVAWKFCGSFILQIGDFCGLREQNFAVRDDWNFWWELIFAILCSSSRIFK